MSSPAPGGTARASVPEPILVIDDDSMVRRAFSRILAAAGYRTEDAEDGDQGLARVRESVPAAVLVDLNMPGMGGLEVISEMRRQSPDTPVIVISGTGVIEDVVQALRRGAWDYVTKPVEDSCLLLQSVGRALERAALLRENRAQRRHLEELNGQLTLAIDELRTDQEAGRRIQFELLPPDGAKFADYTVTRRLYPSQALSGDFVDYFAAGDGHFVFYLADVSGHGAASAFVTAMVAALVGRHREAFARGEDALILNPEGMLASLNADLGLRKLRKHVTMFYGVVDTRARRLSYGSAGQFPYPLLDDGTRITPLEVSGRPLGLFPESRYRGHETSLESVRRLLVPSDGVLEIISAEAGRTKLEELCERFREASGVDALAAALGVVENQRYPDDVTLLLVERSGPNA
jgi:sigma-B regulation protein RsbU (phosphoserine phosphatase)